MGSDMASKRDVQHSVDKLVETLEDIANDDRVVVIPMFGAPRMGTWTVHSDKDTRWNNSGRGCGLVSTGGPKEMWDWIEECKEKYGDQPGDCTVSFWKD
jgi:hypothetical protein